MGLGTVQWGMPYGIANRTGPPVFDEVGRMLQLGRERDVDLLDTASAYGVSEKLLGDHHAADRGYRIVTKTRPLAVRHVAEEQVCSLISGFRDSLRSLGCDHVYGLLMQGADALLVEGGERLWAALEAIKAEGCAAKIGVSVYHPLQLERILDRYPLELVQLPFSVYDQRFKEDRLLCRLQQRGIEVHARSVFVQGLVLLTPEELPPRFASLRAHHADLHRWFRSHGLSVVEGCVRHCLQQPEIDRMVIGCETLAQLRAVLDACAGDTMAELAELARFGVRDDTVIDPTTWRN